MGGINWLQTTVGLTTQKLSNLFQILQGHKNLNSPRKLLAEADRQLALVEEKVQDVYTCDCLDPGLDCILVILPSMYSPTGIFMQGQDNILKWIFFLTTQDLCRKGF